LARGPKLCPGAKIQLLQETGSGKRTRKNKKKPFHTFDFSFCCVLFAGGGVDIIRVVVSVDIACLLVFFVC